MTRSADDAGAMLSAMAGEDPLDPTSLPAPVPDYLASVGGSDRGLKIGIAPADMDGICDAATLRVIDEARRVLTNLGATFHEYSVPPTTAAMRKNWGRYCATETAIAHEATYPSRKDEYGPALAGLIEAGRRLGATDLMKIHHARLEFSGDLRKLFGTFDLLLAPVHPFSNPPIARYNQLLRDPKTMNESLRYTAPYNMSGNPTITLPGGFTEEGLPVGFQLVGRHLDEALLVRAGRAFQQVTDWHRKHPELT
jgi:amidase